MSAPLRLALIGAGRWGRAYLRTIPSVEGCRLARVASRNPETPKLAPPGCVVDADWRAALSAADVDAVVIAAPAAAHAEIAEAALEAGKPVMLEKPATLAGQDARRLLEQARRRGLHVLVDHVYLFHPAYVELKRRARELGPARAVSSAGANWGPFRPDASALWDYGPHDVALCLDLLRQDPRSVSCRVEAEQRRPETLARNLRISLEFPDGARADILVGNLAPSKQRLFAAKFDGCSLVMDDLAASTLVLKSDGDARETAIPVNGKPPLTAAVEAFVAAARAGSSDVSSLELGARVVETLERCQQALEY